MNIRKEKRRILSVLLVLAMTVNLFTPCSIQAETTNEKYSVQNQTETSKTYTEDGFNITFQITSQWNGAYNTNVTIQNTSDKTLQNWVLQFCMESNIVNIWNGVVYQHQGDEYIIKNAGHNQQIAGGQTVSFGFMAETEEPPVLPDSVKILSQEKTADEKDFEVEFRVVDNWNSGFNGELRLKNNASMDLEGWILEFDYAGQIYSFWEADIVEHNQNHYIIKNRGYNYKIASGSILVLGFQGISNHADEKPEHYVLKHRTIGEMNEAPDGKEELEQAYLDLIRKELLMRGLPADSIKLTDDYDKDGLNLKQEYDYDTNPFEKDSDEDGLSDGEEISIYQTDPTDEDTDSDDMCDGTEVKAGLDPLLPDTDRDGVRDDEEIVTQEVNLDMLADMDLSQKGTLPQITLTGKGDYSQKIFAEPVEENDAILEIDSRVGTAYEFPHEKDLTFQSGTLTFQLSSTVLEQNDPEGLAIAWYNEEENSLEPMESKYDPKTKTISAPIKHFSIYMVIDTEKFMYYSDWENESSEIQSGKADIVFVIDTTGSMREPIENIRKNIPAFVKDLKGKNVDARFGLVTFKDIYQNGPDSTKNYGWYISEDAFAEKLKKLTVGGGGGDGPETPVDGLESAYQMRYRTSVKRYVILVTDARFLNGTAKDSTVTLDAQVSKLAQKDIVTSIFTKTNLYPVYQNAIQASGGELADIQNNFAIEAVPLSKKVGKGASGGTWIRLSNNTVIHLIKNPLLNDANADTDKDGIPDVEELGTSSKKRIYNCYAKKYEYQRVWTFSSNPAKKDTDGDTLADGEDLNPRSYDIVITKKTKDKIAFNTGRTWYHIPCTSYDFLDNLFAPIDNSVENPIPTKTFKKIVKCYNMDREQKYNVTELTAIGLLNPEGARLYMDFSKGKTREKVFHNITGRASNKYQHKGILSWEKWEKVSKKKKGSFFKGTVLSEADINFSNKLYRVCDVYTVLNCLAVTGAVVIALVVTVDAAPVVAAHVKALVYYCKTFGIIKGLELYQYLGPQNLPNGVIDWVQKDLEDGDSCLDDLADKGIPIYKRGISGEEALAEKVGGVSQYYMRTAVNGVEGGRYIDQFAGNVAHEAKVGYTCLSKRIRIQIEKDAWLLKQRRVKGVVWHFFRSDITGKVGASKPLLELLKKNGITYVIYD